MFTLRQKHCLKSFISLNYKQCLIVHFSTALNFNYLLEKLYVLYILHEPSFKSSIKCSLQPACGRRSIIIIRQLEIDIAFKKKSMPYCLSKL